MTITCHLFSLAIATVAESWKKYPARRKLEEIPCSAKVGINTLLGESTCLA
jgi:hypothetical protein